MLPKPVQLERECNAYTKCIIEAILSGEYNKAISEFTPLPEIPTTDVLTLTVDPVVPEAIIVAPASLHLLVSRLVDAAGTYTSTIDCFYPLVDQLVKTTVNVKERIVFSVDDIMLRFENGKLSAVLHSTLVNHNLYFSQHGNTDGLEGVNLWGYFRALHPLPDDTVFEITKRLGVVVEVDILDIEDVKVLRSIPVVENLLFRGEQRYNGQILISTFGQLDRLISEIHSHKLEELLNDK